MTNNGIPVAYFLSRGWTNNFAAWAAADPDHDGVPTAVEWQCNTDPTNGASFLHMQQIAPQADRTVIRWQSASNVVYQIQRSTNLVTDAGTAIQSNIPATPPQNTATDATATVAGSCFYWIEIQSH